MELSPPYLSGCSEPPNRPSCTGRSLHWTRDRGWQVRDRYLTPEQGECYWPSFEDVRRLRKIFTELETRPLQAFLDTQD